MKKFKRYWKNKKGQVRFYVDYCTRGKKLLCRAEFDTSKTKGGRFFKCLSKLTENTGGHQGEIWLIWLDHLCLLIGQLALIKIKSPTLHVKRGPIIFWLSHFKVMFPNFLKKTLLGCKSGKRLEKIYISRGSEFAIPNFLNRSSKKRKARSL